MNKNYLTIKRASIIAGLLLGSFAVAVLAESSTWRGPASSPPNCSSGDQGCDSPIHVGGQWQGKAGPLSIGTTNRINNNTPNLNVVGGTLLQNLAVTGSMAINSGNPHPGTVLVSTDNNGTVSWSGGNPQEGQVLTYSNGSVTWKDVTVNNGGGGGNGCNGQADFDKSQFNWKPPACATHLIFYLWGGGGGGGAGPGAGANGGRYTKGELLAAGILPQDRTQGFLIHVANYGSADTEDPDRDTVIHGKGQGIPAGCGNGGITGDISAIYRVNGANRAIVGGVGVVTTGTSGVDLKADGGIGGYLYCSNGHVIAGAQSTAGHPGDNGGGAGGPVGGNGAVPGGGGGGGSLGGAGGYGGKGRVTVVWSNN